MRAFKTRTFNHWARREGLSDCVLLLALAEMQSGLFDARLGGGLFKKRVPRQGMGKRGGYRIILASNLRDRWFFLFGFAKNERSEINDGEFHMLKRIGGALLEMDDAKIAEALSRHELVELKDGKPETS